MSSLRVRHSAIRVGPEEYGVLSVWSGMIQGYLDLCTVSNGLLRRFCEQWVRLPWIYKSSPFAGDYAPILRQQLIALQYHSQVAEWLWLRNKMHKIKLPT